MILPMMGFLFTLFALGILLGFISLLIPHLRFLAGYVFFPPVLGAIGAFTLSWGLALYGERFFNSETVGGLGFFGGYFLGGFMGGIHWHSDCEQIKKGVQVTHRDMKESDYHR